MKLLQQAVRTAKISIRYTATFMLGVSLLTSTAYPALTVYADPAQEEEEATAGPQFSPQTSGMSDVGSQVYNKAPFYDESCGPTTSSTSSATGKLQQIANDAVGKAKQKNVDMRIRVSGGQSAAAGEDGQLPSASVIKLLVAAALSDNSVPLDSVKADLETMLRDSNNESANRLIDRAGGFAAINKTAEKLGIKDEAHIGRKMLEATGGSDPNTISATGSDTLLVEIKQSADSGGKISKEYAEAIIAAMKAQTVSTKWGASGIPKENLAHKTGELNGAQHDVGYFIKGSEWLNVTILTDQPGGSGSDGVEIVKTTAKELYDAWGGDEASSGGGSGDVCCTEQTGAASEVGCGSKTDAEANKKQVWDYLIGKGLTESAAAGIMGNMKNESGFLPTADNGKTMGFTDSTGKGCRGIVQWCHERNDQMEAFAVSTGREWDCLGAQLDNIFREIEEGATIGTADGRKPPGNMKLTDMMNGADFPEKSKYTGTSGPDQAARLFHDYFERANVGRGEHLGRGESAEEIYREITGKTPPGDLEKGNTGASGGATFSSAGGGCGSSSGDASGIAATALKYAWKLDEPQAGGITPKEEYADLVQQAKLEGLYVGGISNPGIDCGGWVTLLVRNSGFDEGYNYDGKGGNTTHQEKWLQENWEKIGSGPQDPATLKAGDVAINGGHTYIFVGEVGDGFGSDIASASLDHRAPQAGGDSASADGFNWYRKK